VSKYGNFVWYSDKHGKLRRLSRLAFRQVTGLFFVSVALFLMLFIGRPGIGVTRFTVLELFSASFGIFAVTEAILILVIYSNLYFRVWRRDPSTG
jgi:membrane protein YdbS with pleckstrin-like domain